MQQAHLGALDAADAQLSILGAAGGALGGLLLLQVLQGASQAQRGAVEVAAAQLKGEQELAVHHQLAHPRRQIPAADCQHIL